MPIVAVVFCQAPSVSQSGQLMLQKTCFVYM